MKFLLSTYLQAILKKNKNLLNLLKRQWTIRQEMNNNQQHDIMFHKKTY